jgi:hypothetical protein
MKNKLNEQAIPDEKYWLGQYRRLIFDKRSIPAWLCLLVGLCFTFLATFSLYVQHQASGSDQFKLHVDQLVN